MRRPGLIFDLDGVLIDSEALQYKAYSRVLAGYGVSVPLEEYARHWIAAGRGPQYAVDQYHLPLQPDELRALKNPVYHDILRAEVILMPGARAALERLQPHFALAVATNSNRQDVDFVLDHFAIRHFFSAIVTSDDYSGRKPEPDAFVTAAHRLALPPEACVVVEDAHKGVVAAHRAGAAVVAVPNAFTRHNDFSLAARILPSLDELTVALVEELGSGVRNVRRKRKT